MGPPEAAVQAEASNRPSLLRLRGVVVSRWGKGKTNVILSGMDCGVKRE